MKTVGSRKWMFQDAAVLDVSEVLLFRLQVVGRWILKITSLRFRLSSPHSVIIEK